MLMTAHGSQQKDPILKLLFFGWQISFHCFIVRMGRRACDWLIKPLNTKKIIVFCAFTFVGLSNYYGIYYTWRQFCCLLYLFRHWNEFGMIWQPRSFKTVLPFTFVYLYLMLQHCSEWVFMLFLIDIAKTWHTTGGIAPSLFISNKIKTKSWYTHAPCMQRDT